MRIKKLFISFNIVVLIFAALGLGGCGKEQAGNGRGSGGTGKATQAETAEPAEPPAWRVDGFAGRITAVRSQPGLLEADLALPTDLTGPFFPVGFNFCLPEKLETTLRVRPCEAGGAQTGATAGAEIDTTHSLALQFAGVMRDAAIWRLAMNEVFWQPWIELAKGGPELRVTVEVRWKDKDVAAGSEAKAGTGAKAEKDGGRGMERVQRHFVANPEDLGKWPVKKPQPPKGLSLEMTDPRPLAPGAGPWMRFRVERDGLYRITEEDLRKGGGGRLEAGGTSNTLSNKPSLAAVRVFTQGRPVPVQRVRIGGQDAILFYGWASRSPYDSKQNYWLTLATNQTPDPIMGGQAATATTATQDRIHVLNPIHKIARLEQDNALKLAHAEFMRIVEATWVDRELVDDTTLTLPLALDAPVPTSPTATLKTEITFYPDGNPELWTGTEAELRHGDKGLGRFAFTPNDESFVRAVELPVSVFKDGHTTLTLAVTRATTATLPTEDNKEGIWLDKVEVHYDGYPTLANGRLVLDTAAVTSHTTGTLYRVGVGTGGMSLPAEATYLLVHPQQQEVRVLPVNQGHLDFSMDGGWQAEVFDAAAAPAPKLEPAEWPDELLADPGADVLILTHAMFKDAVTSLSQFHARRGLKTRVVDVHQIYDRFGDGMLSPLAIRAYLAYAGAHWRGGAPQYLILFGDCSEDYRGRYRSPARNLVPSYTYVLDNEEWPSDYWYSLLAGEDALPDLIVARMPAASTEDARAMIAKTIRYAGDGLLGPWRGRHALIADNIQDYRGMAETARLEYTPTQFETPRLYLDELPLEDNWYSVRTRIDNLPVEHIESIRKVSAAATNAIKDLLNSGAPVLEYFGHGSPNLWAHERIWFGGGSERRDSLFLKTDGRYAFIINYTCATGKIDYPIEPWNICIAEDFLRTAGGGAIALFVPAGFGSPPMQAVLMRQWHAALFRDRLRGLGELATLVRGRYAADQASESHLFMYQLLGDPTIDLQLATQWRALEVSPAAFEPGVAQAVQASLKGVEPAQGKAQLWVEDERGQRIWEGQPFEYSGGAIEAKIEIPAVTDSPQRLRVALYAWNEAEGRDLLAAGTAKIQRPAVLIRAAQAKRGDKGGLGFEIEVENDSAVPADDVKLGVFEVPGGAEPIAGLGLKLGAGERRRVELNAGQMNGASGRSDLLAFEAVVTTPQPPDDPGIAYPLRHRFALAPAPQWIGWAPALGHFRDHPVRVDEVTVCALSGGPTSGTVCAVWHAAAGDQVTTIPMDFTAAADGAFISSVTLPMTMERKPGPKDLLELVSPVPGAAPRVLSRMKLGELPLEAPRLRLDPQSIRHLPDDPSPTDGETIFVSFTVSNAGNAPSPPCQPALLQKPYAKGGRPLPFRSQYPETALPALGAGRSAPVTLRWDPFDNAGVQPLIVDVDPSDRRTTESQNEQSAALRLYVRTKSRLSRGQPLPPVRVAPGVFKLRVEVINEGETDARNVEVSYYRMPDKKAEDLLGTVLLKVVPAARDGKPGRAIAELGGCRLDEEKDRPVSEVRLKGSAQTITD